MRPRERGETSEQDLFRSRLDQIIDMKHAGAGDRLGFSGADVWGGLHRQAGPAAVADAADGGAGDPQAHLRPFRRGSVRSMVENPYFQYFWREAVFQHTLVFSTSQLPRSCQLLG